MFEIGQKVLVKEPFNQDFPLEYEILEKVDSEDGQVAFVLEVAGAFDPKYLEPV